MLTFKESQKVPEEILRAFPEYPPAITQLLFDRGLVAQADIDAFLNPEYHETHDPFLFKDMKKAVERIYKAIQSNELIAVHGDYDADGVSASAILHTVITKLGGQTTIYIPHREKEGYGLNKNTIDYLHKLNTALIITCDCGISNVEEVAYANKYGIDTIITDHHLVPEKLPSAHAIIHPKIDDETYPFRELAGGGVAFKLIQGLLASKACKLSKLEKEQSEKWLLDLVALSTVADMVPLLGENRILVSYGLIVLRKARRLGFQKLFEQGKIDSKKITTETISFQIAPRINAAGRVDHANTAYRLLISETDDEAQKYAADVETQNRERQRLTEIMYKEAIADIGDEHLIIRYQEDWLPGLTGLVAGKVMNEFNRPVYILCSDGEKIVGSGRSPEGVNVLEGVTAIKDKLLSFGGHVHACGFRFATKKKEEVIGALREFYSEQLQSASADEAHTIHGILELKDIDWTFIDYLSKFEPFGKENEEPLFASKGVQIDSYTMVGKKKNHAKMKLTQGDKTLPGIGFGIQEELINHGKPVTIVYNARINEWNGNREIQLMIKKVLIHD